MSALTRRLAFGAVVVMLATTCTDIVRVELDTQPRIVSTIPASGASEVDLATPVVVYFSEPVDPTTVTTESLTVLSDGVPVNGTATVTATAATLTFESPLAYLTTYTAVTTTAILDLTGASLSSAKTWTFTTRDLAWSADNATITPVGITSYRGLPVFDSLGNAWVPFQQGTAAADLLVRRYRFNQGWLPSESIENRPEPVFGGSLAIDASGNVIAVWIQSDGTAESLWSNRWQASVGGWSGPQLLESQATRALSPSLVVDSAGNAIVTWIHDDPAGPSAPSDLWWTRYEPGTGWDTPSLLETSEAGPVNYTTLAGDPSGRAIAMWTQSDGSVLNVLASRYVPGSGWTTPIPIDSSSGDTQYGNLVMDRAGRALACFPDSTAVVFCNRFDGSSWDGAIPIAFGAFTIGMGPNGHAAMIYFEGSVPYLVRVRIFDPDFGWSTAETIDSSVNAPLDPALAVDARGTVVATYTLFDGTFYDPWVTRKVGGTWSLPAHVESEPEPVFRVPVILRADGLGIAVWNQSDGVNSRVWASALR